MSSFEAKVWGNLEGEKRTRIPVVRVYPWSIITAKQALSTLRDGLEPTLIEINMALKSRQSVASANMLTPIGGQKNPGESDLEAAYRETREETTLHIMPYSDKLPIYIVEGKDAYTYTIPFGKYANEDRETSLVSFPVLSTQIAKAHASDKEQDKIEQIVQISIDELRKAQIRGQVRGLKLIESSANIGSSGIQISPLSRLKRENALEGLLDFLTETEEEIKKRVIKNICAKPIVKEQCKKPYRLLADIYKDIEEAFGPGNAESFIRIAIDEVNAEMYAEYFRGKETELGQEFAKLQERTIINLHALGLTVQALTSDTEKIWGEKIFGVEEEKNGLTNLNKIKTRAKWQADLIKLGLNKGNRGVDILHLLTLLTQTKSNAAMTTKTAVALQSFMLNGFTAAALENNETPQTLFRKLGTYGEVNTDFKTRLHKSFINFIAEAFGFETKYVEGVFREIDKYIPEFGEILKAHDPKLSRLYQAHEERNETRGAYLPELCMYAFQDSNRVVKFESGRKILIFFKALLAKHIFDRKFEAGNKFFDDSILKYFGKVVPNKVYRIREENMDNIMEIRSNGQYYFIVDQKPWKLFNSFLRKSFEEDPENINDIFSYGFWLVGPVKGHDLLLEQRIAVMEKVTENYLASLENQGFEIEKSDDETTYNFFLDRLNGKVVIIEGRPGKRTGSRSKYIVRRQMVLKARGYGIKNCCEHGFYPVVDMSNPYKKEGYMGAGDKHKDDPRYGKDRVTQPIVGTDGTISMHGCLFPPEHYEEFLVVQPRKQSKKI